MDVVYPTGERLEDLPAEAGRGSREQYGNRRGGPRPTPFARMDNALMYTTLALVMVGLMSVFTASAAQADLETGNAISVLLKQIISAVIGGAALWTLARFPFERWKNLARPFSLISIGLLLMTMFMGTTAIHGHHRQWERTLDYAALRISVPAVRFCQGGRYFADGSGY
ncbi:MAG: Cell cycle protein [Vampirovibrio sp.]|nr:Cell cycle protein [Vampirovibrio sp.]